MYVGITSVFSVLYSPRINQDIVRRTTQHRLDRGPETPGLSMLSCVRGFLVYKCFFNPVDRKKNYSKLFIQIDRRGVWRRDVHNP